jgi:hypothetical protein
VLLMAVCSICGKTISLKMKPSQRLVDAKLGAVNGCYWR